MLNALAGQASDAQFHVEGGADYSGAPCVARVAVSLTVSVGEAVVGLSGAAAPPMNLIQNSALGESRIYPIPADFVNGRVPSDVTVRSSTSLTNSLDPNAYETSYGTATLAFTGLPVLVAGQPPSDNRYASVRISAPAGTQSLFLDFTSTGGTRISEIQAFVPEPAAMAVLGLAAPALLARRRRR